MYFLWGLLLADVSFLLILTPFLLGLPSRISLPVSAIAIIVAPIILGLRVTRRWNKEAPSIIGLHPVWFLRKVRALRNAGYLIEVLALGFLIVYFAGQPVVSTVLAGAPLQVSFFYFFIIEVVLLQVTLNFWRPDPLVSLRACLMAEEDSEKARRESWLDDALDYFNLLKARNFALGIQDEVSLDALLLGSPSRRPWASFLLRDIDSSDYLAFLSDLSEISLKPVSELVGKVGFLESVRKNQWAILSVVVPLLVVLATSLSLLHAIVDPVIRLWSNLLKSLQ